MKRSLRLRLMLLVIISLIPCPASGQEKGRQRVVFDTEKGDTESALNIMNFNIFEDHNTVRNRLKSIESDIHFVKEKVQQLSSETESRNIDLKQEWNRHEDRLNGKLALLELKMISWEKTMVGLMDKVLQMATNLYEETKELKTNVAKNGETLMGSNNGQQLTEIESIIQEKMDVHHHEVVNRLDIIRNTTSNIEAEVQTISHNEVKTNGKQAPKGKKPGTGQESKGDKKQIKKTSTTRKLTATPSPGMEIIISTKYRGKDREGEKGMSPTQGYTREADKQTDSAELKEKQLEAESYEPRTTTRSLASTFYSIDSEEDVDTLGPNITQVDKEDRVELVASKGLPKPSDKHKANIKRLKVDGNIVSVEVFDAMMAIDLANFVNEHRPLNYLAHWLEDTVVHVNEGSKVLNLRWSGYLSSCLSLMVGTNGSVVGLIDNHNKAEAIRVKHQSLFDEGRLTIFVEKEWFKGAPSLAPYDLIIIISISEAKSLSGQLKEGGKIFLPISNILWEKGEGGQLNRIYDDSVR